MESEYCKDWLQILFHFIHHGLIFHFIFHSLITTSSYILTSIILLFLLFTLSIPLHIHPSARENGGKTVRKHYLSYVSWLEVVVAVAISPPATDTNSGCDCDCDCDCDHRDQGRDATTSWWSWTLFVTRTGKDWIQILYHFILFKFHPLHSTH